ncbi:Tn3 family transposase [Streptomyces koyangensis]|uniref:Tn3 family transposase n=1 Tax=Streptomyces koyangensis TaxID=188770 RepID=UPI003C30C049
MGPPRPSRPSPRCRRAAGRCGRPTDVEANYTDSHGQSEIGFGVTRLLNFDLLPRTKRINKVKPYRPVAGEPDAYPRLPRR